MTPPTFWCSVLQGPAAVTDGVRGRGPSDGSTLSSRAASVDAFGTVWGFGGKPAGAAAPLAALRRTELDAVRWVRPMPSSDMYQYVQGRSGSGAPQFFEEVLVPQLSKREHTATLVGDVLVVPGADGNRLGTHLLHTPSLTWHAPLFEGMLGQAPKVAWGHAAALLPGRKAIAVFGGVVPAETLPGARSKPIRLSRELRVLQLRLPGPDDHNADTACWPQPEGWLLQRDRAAPSGAAGQGAAAAASASRVPRCAHTLTALPRRFKWNETGLAEGAVLLFGGQDHTGAVRNDARLLHPTDCYWVDLNPSGSPPPPRAGHAAACGGEGDGPDGGHGCAAPVTLVVFGGYGAPTGVGSSRTAAPLYNDVHVLALDGWASGACRWSSPRLGGPPPSPRSGAVAVALPSGGVLVLGGGDHTGAIGTTEPGVEASCVQLAALSAAALTDSPTGGDEAWMWPWQAGDVPDAPAALTATRVGGMVYVVVLPPHTASDHQARTGCVHILELAWVGSHQAMRQAFRTRRICEARLSPPPASDLSIWSGRASAWSEDGRVQLGSLSRRSSLGTRSDTPRAPLVLASGGEPVRDQPRAELWGALPLVLQSAAAVKLGRLHARMAKTRSLTITPYVLGMPAQAINEPPSLDQQNSSSACVEPGFGPPRSPAPAVAFPEPSSERRACCSAAASAYPRPPSTPANSPGPLTYALPRDDWLRASSLATSTPWARSASLPRGTRNTTLRAVYNEPKVSDTPGPGAYEHPSSFSSPGRGRSPTAASPRAAADSATAPSPRRTWLGGAAGEVAAAGAAAGRRVSLASTSLDCDPVVDGVGTGAVADDSGRGAAAAPCPPPLRSLQARDSSLQLASESGQPLCSDHDARVCGTADEAGWTTAIGAGMCLLASSDATLHGDARQSEAWHGADGAGASAPGSLPGALVEWHSTRATGAGELAAHAATHTLRAAPLEAAAAADLAEEARGEHGGTRHDAGDEEASPWRASTQYVGAAAASADSSTSRRLAGSELHEHRDPASARLRDLGFPRWETGASPKEEAAAADAGRGGSPPRRGPPPPRAPLGERQPSPRARHPRQPARDRDTPSPARNASERDAPTLARASLSRAHPGSARRAADPPTASFSSGTPRSETPRVRVRQSTRLSAEMGPGDAERARGRALALALALRKPVVTRKDGARFSMAAVKLMRKGDRLTAAYGRISSSRGTGKAPGPSISETKS